MPRGDCGIIRIQQIHQSRFLGLAMIGKNKPKNTSHRPKFPSWRLERKLAEPNGAHRDPWEASRHLPWVTTEKKSSVKRPMGDLRTPSREVSWQPRPRPVRHGSATEATESSAAGSVWFWTLSVASEGGAWREDRLHPGTSHDASAREIPRGDVGTFPRRESRARIDRRARGDPTVARAPCQKNEPEGCPAPNRRFREKPPVKPRRNA
mmetsp:Transcript_11952/g.50279  ORF Transcript_11952/g.50279 Transcript_11952/m.50279 type:complete len:208 (-) Transcript_11952:45-668(-)